MKTLTSEKPRTILLTAPADGRVHLCPPRALCGELEIYERGEAVARVDGRTIEAPGNGYILRALARDGTFATDGMPLMEFRIT